MHNAIARKNPNMEPIASSPKRISRISASLCFRTMFANEGFTRPKLQDQVGMLAHALESKNKDSPSTSIQVRGSTTAPPRCATKLLAIAELTAVMHQTTKKEAKRVYKNKAKASMAKEAENALFEAFKIGFGSFYDGQKITSFYFVNCRIKKMQQTNALVSLFDHNKKPWLRSSTFLGAFVGRALILHGLSAGLPSLLKITWENVLQNTKTFEHCRFSVLVSGFFAGLIEVLIKKWEVLQICEGKASRDGARTHKYQATQRKSTKTQEVHRVFKQLV